MVDKTFELITEPGLKNLLLHAKHSGPRKDILEYRPREDYKRIVICGAGASLDEVLFERKIKKGDLLVSNQGSFETLRKSFREPDIYLCVDPQRVAIAPYAAAVNEYVTLIAATTAHPSYQPFGPQFFFKSFAHNPEKLPKLERYNYIVDFFDEHVNSFVLQVGSVVNASILVVDYLMKQKVLKNVPIILAGVDCGDYKGRFRVTEGKNYPEPLREHLTTDSHGFSTVQHREYLKQLALILASIPLDIQAFKSPRLEPYMEVLK
jgi:hypothetical protein